MNIVNQDTINKHGNTIPKFCLTHDQSFKFEGGSNTSLKSRLQKDKLNPCYFGWVILRLINWILAARKKYPNQRLFAMKVSTSIAKLRCNHAPNSQRT